MTTANTTNEKRLTALAKCKILGGFEEKTISTDEGECTVFTAESSRTKVILLPADAEQTVLTLDFNGEAWDMLIVK